MEDAQVYSCQPALATRLLGDDAFHGSSTIVKPVVGKFVRTLLSIAWNWHRKVNHREVNKIDTGVREVGEKWKCASLKCCFQRCSSTISVIE